MANTKRTDKPANSDLPSGKTTTNAADSGTKSSGKDIVGFEDMPSIVDYRTAYPQTTGAFLKRLLIAFTRTPAVIALVAMGLQYGVFCDFPMDTTATVGGAAAFSPNELLFGVPNAEERTGTFVIEALRDTSPALQFGIFVLVFRLLTTIICHSFYLFIEKRNLLSEYKIPRQTQTIPSEELRSDTFKHYIVELAMAPVVLYFVTRYGVRHVDHVCQPLSFAPTALFIMASFFLNETGFYWSHRLLHEIPFLYRTIHKKHHKFIGSISIAAEYSHPLENAFSSALPLIFLILFVPTSPIVFALWVSYRLIETFESHSGYCFDGTFVSQKLNLTHSAYTLFHDFHHVANKGNYGQGGIFWDYVCGTDALFKGKMAAAGARRLAKKSDSGKMQ